MGGWDIEAFLDDPEHTTPVNKKSMSPFVRCVVTSCSLRNATEEKKDKGKGKFVEMYEIDAELKAQLEAQWAKDRAKKTARKQKRLEARYLAALDPLIGKQGRASRKAMRAAVRLEESVRLAIAPRAVVDMSSLEAQIRRFVEDGQGHDEGEDEDEDEDDDGDDSEDDSVGPETKAKTENGKDKRVSRTSMALPPMDSWMRKAVHELAAAFGVKSVSKGKGAARYTTLFRTSGTGVGVNEGKVRALVKRYGGRGKGKGKGKGEKGGRGQGRGGRMPKQREGDEVGKEAPKIGEGNIGFRMLARMGWSEGHRIGGTGSVGIETPLTAIIKYSKLGLGATQ